MKTGINTHSKSLYRTLQANLKAPSSALLKNSGEVGAIAKSIGSVIQNYTKKIHNNLEDWYQLGEELNDLLKLAKPLSQLLITLKEISVGSDNVTISGKEAALFLEIGHLLGDSYTKNVHITQISLTMPNGGTWGLKPDSGGEQLYYVYQQTENFPLKDCTNIQITLSPSDATQVEKGFSQSGDDLLSLSGISQKTTALKHKQTNDLFKIMALTNAKKSNENSLSSIVQLLRSISSTALGNLQ